MLHPFRKGGCRNGCRKGVSLPVKQKNCVLLNTIFRVFPAKHSNCRKRCVSCTGKENLPKIVGCCSRCRKVFLALHFLFSWRVLGFCLFGFCFLQRAKKGHFPAILKFSVLFCSPKSPFSNYFLSSSWLSSYFSFVFPFKIPSLLFLILH